jgi:hypothetical protein
LIEDFENFVTFAWTLTAALVMARADVQVMRAFLVAHASAGVLLFRANRL